MTGQMPVHRAGTWDASVAEYERLGEPFTRQYAEQALLLAGQDWQGRRVLDVAAGTGALTLPAARAGALVLGVDFSPGMVARLNQRLAEEGLAAAGCAAQVMDGQALDLPDGGFDAAFSIFGVMMFPDYRRGLAELVRVLRPGGTACVAVWTQSGGAGPAPLLAEILRTLFPDQPRPTPPPGMQALITPDGLSAALAEAGLDGVTITTVSGAWQAPSADWVADNAGLLFRQSPIYAALGEGDSLRLHQALRDRLRADYPAEVRIPAQAHVGVGRRP